MARRPSPRTYRRRRNLVWVQLLTLVFVLAFILFFRDVIGLNAGALFGSFGSDDVRLPPPSTATPHLDLKPEADAGAAASEPVQRPPQ